MSVSQITVRQLLKEFFDDYTNNDKFSYTFGTGQFLVTEVLNKKHGVTKLGIIALLNEYFEDFTVKDIFICDLQNGHFLVAVQTAIFKELPEGQKYIAKPDEFCTLKNQYCEHVNISNNKEIGYTICNGEYCDIIKKNNEIKNNDHDKIVARHGFGEKEILD